jgi:hypothetical protein
MEPVAAVHQQLDQAAQVELAEMENHHQLQDHQ